MNLQNQVQQDLTTLRSVIEIVPSELAKIPVTQAESKPSPEKWSRKEELGHLIDSAFNNHRRLLLGQLEEKLDFPSYDGEQWVRLNAYQTRNWSDLIELWKLSNQQLLVVAQSAPSTSWSKNCSLENLSETTLGFVLQDYVEHMKHHLKRIGVLLKG